ncbi:hypothetical protein [Spirosoma endbachense]|uniref:Uncharacterized protein n=1 Tax=Spirosoma endbachense TaxID=2666025 RepID=A0A6P1VTI4_9BACT|nr:hypothetical protein [Spirosoma endbachense]QHV95300.1 hypothetical protein GJR95_09865 [Spirosoma endbachense]
MTRNSPPAGSSIPRTTSLPAKPRPAYKTSFAGPVNFTGGYPISSQIFVPLPGTYPKGFEPRWSIKADQWDKFFLKHKIALNLESNTTAKSVLLKEETAIGIMDYQGRTVLRFDAIGCKCVADLDLPAQKLTLNESPIRFGLSNFRKLQVNPADDPNAPCQNMASFTHGGWAGYITLSANSQSTITMDLLLENYSSPRYRNGMLTYKFFGTNIAIPNQMTADQAIAVKKRDEEREEQRRLAAIAYEKEKEEKARQFELKIKNSLSKVIKEQASFVHAGKSGCLKVDQGVNQVRSVDPGKSFPVYRDIPTDDGSFKRVYAGESRTEDQVTYTPVSYKGHRNTCSSPVTILGISKHRSDKGTIYYEDASIVLNSNEITETLIDIEETYNARTAEVGSTHYFKR